MTRTSNRQERADMAQETLRVLDTGVYKLAGQRITVPDLAPMGSGTRLYAPEDAPALRAALEARRDRFVTQVQVIPEDTLSAARRVQAQHGRVAALNFASARSPGGGFLSGARAQEEDLARCSGLYLSLTSPAAQRYYDANRAAGTALYTHHLIYSPSVPVFRDASGAFLPAPIPVNVVTAPAPNAGVVRERDPARVPEIAPVLRERASLVLAVAAAQGDTNLILGAWGCGVFRNAPEDVAGVFRDLLRHEAAGVFERVVFAVLDNATQQPTLGAFERQLSALTPQSSDLTPPAETGRS